MLLRQLKQIFPGFFQWNVIMSCPEAYAGMVDEDASSLVDMLKTSKKCLRVIRSMDCDMASFEVYSRLFDLDPNFDADLINRGSKLAVKGRDYAGSNRFFQTMTDIVGDYKIGVKQILDYVNNP